MTRSLSWAAFHYFGGWGNALEAAEVKLPPKGRNLNRDSIVKQIQHFHRQGVPVGKVWKQDRALMAASSKHFGSWRAALEAAGLNSQRKQWSQQRVILELQKHRGPRKNIQDNLVCAARRYFGTLSNAIVAAGVDFPVEPRRKLGRSRWSRESVLQAIQRGVQEKGSLSSTRINNPGLYAVAQRMFGGWREALRHAGYDVRSPVNLSRDEVIERIVLRRKQGLPLVCMREHDMDLYRSAFKQFGTWRRAMLAAGQIIKPRHNWSKQKIIDGIIEHHRDGSLSRVWREDKKLFHAGNRKFGNWGKALLAAGFPCKTCKKWSQERVIRELQFDCRQLMRDGQTVNLTLAAAARRYFGTLQNAMEAADIEIPLRKWTQQSVIDAIQGAYVNGRSINVAGCGDNPLASAARRYFGSWIHAVEAAGLSNQLQQPPLQGWTRTRVVDAILSWDREGRPLNKIYQRDQGLYAAAKHHFGTWRTALCYAGIKRTQRVWSKPRILADIQQRSSEGVSLNCNLAINGALTSAAVRHFGSWSKALEAAGVTQDQEQSLCHAKI